MNKILVLSLALLSVTSTQIGAMQMEPIYGESIDRNNQWAQPGTQTPDTLSNMIKSIITKIDPKKNQNVIKLHKVKSQALHLVRQTNGILAPEAQTKITSVINSLGSEETLFILGKFLTTLLVQIEQYRLEYHHGMELGPITSPERISTPREFTFPGGFPHGFPGQQNKPDISLSKTHFVPGETITNHASSGSGAGTEYGTYTSYSANPKGSIETSQWGTMPGNSGQTQIRISPNAKPGKVIIYQTTEGGRPTRGQQSKPHKKIYKTITVVKGPLQVQNHSAVTSSHPQNLEQPDMPSGPPVME